MPFDSSGLFPFSEEWPLWLYHSLNFSRSKESAAMWEIWVWSLGWEDPLEVSLATHSSILAWRIPWMEETGGIQPMELRRVRHDWMTERTHSQTSWKQRHKLLLAQDFFLPATAPSGGNLDSQKPQKPLQDISWKQIHLQALPHTTLQLSKQTH